MAPSSTKGRTRLGPGPMQQLLQHSSLRVIFFHPKVSSTKMTNCVKRASKTTDPRITINRPIVASSSSSGTPTHARNPVTTVRLSSRVHSLRHLRLSARYSPGLQTFNRASNKSSQRFYNHEEGPY